MGAKRHREKPFRSCRQQECRKTAQRGRYCGYCIQHFNRLPSKISATLYREHLLRKKTPAMPPPGCLPPPLPPAMPLHAPGSAAAEVSVSSVQLSLRCMQLEKAPHYQEDLQAPALELERATKHGKNSTGRFRKLVAAAKAAAATASAARKGQIIKSPLPPTESPMTPPRCLPPQMQPTVTPSKCLPPEDALPLAMQLHAPGSPSVSSALPVLAAQVSVTAAEHKPS